MSWPVGRPAVNVLISERQIERVAPNLDGGQANLAAAARHLASAAVLADSDPEGAYALVYDAARKSLTALLLTQGLRATAKGGHVAVERVIAAQFTSPPPSQAFRPFRRLRQTRHQAEYDHVQAVNADLVRADRELVVTIHSIAAALLPELPVYTG